MADPIYASPYGGAKYHAFPNCNGLNSSASALVFTEVPEVTRAEAKRRGLTPCVLCKPAPLLEVVTDG